MFSDELDGIPSQLEKINDSLAGVEKAIVDSSTLNILYKIVMIWAGTFAGFFFLEKAWHSSIRYSIQYSVDRSHVHSSKEPHDCNFLAAPIGSKYCKYEISVSTLQWARSSEGNPIASSDDGKTWYQFTPDSADKVPARPTVQEVTIAWQKSDDD